MPSKDKKKLDLNKMGLDEDYINSLKKDPVAWQKFVKKGEALVRLMEVIKNISL